MPLVSPQRNLSYSSCDTTKLEEAIAAVAANAFAEKEGKLCNHFLPVYQTVCSWNKPIMYSHDVQ